MDSSEIFDDDDDDNDDDDEDDDDDDVDGDDRDNMGLFEAVSGDFNGAYACVRKHKQQILSGSICIKTTSATGIYFDIGIPPQKVNEHLVAYC